MSRGHGPSLLLGALTGVLLGLAGGFVAFAPSGDSGKAGTHPSAVDDSTRAAAPERGTPGSEETAAGRRRLDGSGSDLSVPSPARTDLSTVADDFLSMEQLLGLLASASRLDQVRAIERLSRSKTLEAHRALLDAFVRSTDPILLALLEEALLESPLDVAPTLLDAFDASKDPAVLERLAGTLTKLVAKRPALVQGVVERFIESLDASGLDPARSDSASKALVAIGIGALDRLAAYVADSLSDPEGAGTAAWIMAQLAPEHGDALREKLGAGFDGIHDALRNAATDEASKTAVLEKTGSLAWAASLRPPSEHDRLADLLVANLTRTGDPSQAGTLAWGIGNLKGLTEEARLRLAQSLVHSLSGQANSTIAHAYVAAVNDLVTSGGARPVDGNFYGLFGFVEDAWKWYGEDPNASPHLRWLLAELRAHEKGSGH